jgi:DNA-binding transcriptional LysR family regulator
VHVETLKTFCDLVETGSFSKAAALNFVSQSAVSQQVRALEQRWGKRLVERGGRRGVTRTEAGQLLYAESKAILERFRVLDTLMRGEPRRLTGTVRIATVYSVGLHELPPYVKEFLVDHPRVNVRLEYARTDRVYAGCLDGSLDLGIVALPSRRPQLHIVPLRHDELILVVSPDHPLARVRERTPLAQLRDEPFISFDRDIPTRKAIDRILRKHGARVRSVMEFDNIETIKRSVEAGLGVSILPAKTVQHEIGVGTLVACPLVEGPFYRAVGLIHRRGRELSPAAQAFVDLLLQRMGEVTPAGDPPALAQKPKPVTRSQSLPDTVEPSWASERGQVASTAVIVSLTLPVYSSLSLLKVRAVVEPDRFEILPSSSTAPVHVSS